MLTWLAAALKKLPRSAPSRRHALVRRAPRACLSFDCLEARLVPAVTPIIGPNINITKSSGITDSENSIVINPKNTKNVFAASTKSGDFKYSMDGGVTWSNSDVSALTPTGGDQQMAWDSFGNLFLVQLAIPSVNNITTTVVLSTDGGAKFTQLLDIGAFGDQPSIAVGPNSVWFCYTLQGQVLARGATVTGLGSVGTFGSAQNPGGPEGNFGDIAVGQNGQVMMVCQEQNGTSGAAAEGPSELYYCVDPDGTGSQGFTNNVLIVTTNCGSYDAIPNQPNRKIGAEVNLAWDRASTVHKGRVYLVYVEENVDESDDMDIIVRYSDNNGTTWSAPVRVNDDTLGNRKSQFNPAIAVDQTTGDIAVTWYDARNSASNNTAQVFGTFSQDGGATWAPNFRISNGVSNSQTSAANGSGFDWGDYDKMDFHGGVFFRAWADNSNSTGDNPDGANNEFDLYTAQVTIPSSGGGGGGGGGTTGGITVRLYNPVRYVWNRVTKTFDGVLTYLNKDTKALAGDVYLIFSKLPAGVTVTNKTGNTKDGKQYIKVAANLKAKTAARITIKLNNPQLKPFASFFFTGDITMTATDPTK